MEDSGVFKSTTFGGFEKKSVLTYIDSLNEEFHEAELKYQEKLEAYEKAQESQLSHIKSLEEQITDGEGKLAAVANQLEEERKLANQANSMISELQSSYEILKKKLDDNERELQIQLERNRQLQFKVESLEYKSRKYDDFSTQIGDTIIEAKQNAEKIIRSANARAKEISMQAQDYMKNFYTELSSFSGDAANLQKSVEEILFVLNDRVDVMQDIIHQVQERLHPDDVQLDYTEQNEPILSDEPKNENESAS
mgnify:CR=1 FL=1